MRGTSDGIGPLVGITTTLLVAVAMVSLVNQGLALIPGAPTLEGLFAQPFRPVLWLIGIPWSETGPAGLLMGTKTVLNEFVSYLKLAHLPTGTLSDRSKLIMTYAMCGFANFGSIGIMVGGMSAMIPERRQEIVTLATRSIVFRHNGDMHERRPRRHLRLSTTRFDDTMVMDLLTTGACKSAEQLNRLAPL